MNKTILAAVVIVLVGVLVFAPIVPVSRSSSWFFGAGNTQTTADVSPTFLLLHCGAIVNAQASNSLLGFNSTSPVTQGYNFICNFRITSESRR